jgi:phosphohistidine phosphatase
MEILLLRHGIAESEIAAARHGRRDEERRLTAEGRRETDRMAAALSARVGRLDRIFHSPYLRARETAEIFSPHFSGAPILQVEEFTPDSDPRQLAGFLESQNGARIMIVSHEPYLSGALSYLLSGGFSLALGFERAAVAGIEWGGAGRSRLNYFLPPRLLLDSI